MCGLINVMDFETNSDSIFFISNFYENGCLVFTAQIHCEMWMRSFSMHTPLLLVWLWLFYHYYSMRQWNFSWMTFEWLWFVVSVYVMVGFAAPCWSIFAYRKSNPERPFHTVLQCLYQFRASMWPNWRDTIFWWGKFHWFSLPSK